MHVSQTRHTARFVCTNDSSHAQIATFYAGAMSEAREIELKPIVDRVGAPDFVLIGPDDPQGMLRHTDECRQRGYRFVADPSQQLAFGDGDMIRPLIDGAEILFSNEYEARLITQKTGWSHRRGPRPRRTWVTTLGAEGVRVDRQGEESIAVPAVPEIEKVEPTGVGDAFRAGFLAALGWGLSLERAAQFGCLLAVYVVEQVGTQEYVLSRAAFLGALRGDVRRRRDRRLRAAPANPAPAESSATPTHQVARCAVRGGVLPDVLLRTQATPRRYVDSRRRVVRDQPIAHRSPRPRCAEPAR